MLIRLISLVILFINLNISNAFNAENNNFIYPQKKPSVFNKLNLKKNILPLNKPKGNQKKLSEIKDSIKPQPKPTKDKKAENKKDIKDESKPEKILKVEKIEKKK